MGKKKHTPNNKKIQQQQVQRQQVKLQQQQPDDIISASNDDVVRNSCPNGEALPSTTSTTTATTANPPTTTKTASSSISKSSPIVERQDETDNSNNSYGNSNSNISDDATNDDNCKDNPLVILIHDWKQMGNDLFLNKEYVQSREAYDKAIALLEDNDDNTISKALTLLLVQLLSNRAMVSIKLNNYDESILDCNRIIDTMAVSDQPKVWYRRALALEGKATSILLSHQKNSHSNNHNSTGQQPNDQLPTATANGNENEVARTLLLQAKHDLQQCLKAVQHQQQNKNNCNMDNSMKITVSKMATRIQKVLLQIDNTATSTKANTAITNGTKSKEVVVSPKTVNAASTNGVATHNDPSISVRILDRPSPEQQQRDVLKLLISRKVSIINQYQTLQQQQQEALMREGFFIIHWKWWCQFTKYTNMFHTNNTTVNNNTNNNQHQILQYLISGSIVPNHDDDDDSQQNKIKKPSNKRTKNQSNNNNNECATVSSSSSSSSDGDDDDDWSIVQPPGPIDNSELLLPYHPERNGLNSNNDNNTSTSLVFYRQWYSKYYQQSQCANHDGNCHTETTSSSTSDQQQQRQEELRHSNNYSTTTTTGPSLRPNLVRGYHYELLPREVYNALRTWYGENSIPICKRTTTKANDILEIVLYPSLFSNGNSMKSDDVTTNGAMNQKCVCDACRAPGASMRCRRCLSVWYCNRGCQESHWPYHKVICKELVKSHDIDNNNRNLSNNANFNFSILDGRVGLNNLGNTCFMNSAIQCLSHATPLTRHFLSGLFKSDINATNPLGTGGKLALAYAIVVKDLWWGNDTKRSKNDNNGGNDFTPVTYHSTSPTALKRAIALFAPRFAGYLQHDTQEFLAYLLDGLHEDLNRISNAPYVEMPDVSATTNMSIAAAKCWDAHKRRNDSIVLDTFYGQFKSTCVCPNCNKVSVSFDTFNHVSLEIPQPIKPVTDVVPFPVVLCRKSTDPNQHPPIPIRYGVPYRHSPAYRIPHFRKELSDLCQMPSSQIVLCEIYRNTIVNIYHDDNPKPLTDVIHVNDYVVAYEMEHPFGSTALHVIASHCFVDSVAAKQTGRAPQDRHPPPDPFGRPIMTSFLDNLTCQQVWDHIWSHVGHLVNKIESTPLFDDKSLLRIRVVDAHGRAKDAFPAVRARASSHDSDSTIENVAPATNNHDENTAPRKKKALAHEMTSILPRDSNELFKDCIGKDGDAFIFLSLEWTDPTDEIQYDDNGEEIDQTKVVEHHIDEERFMTFNYHSSWVEAVQKIKAASANSSKKSVTLEECLATFTKPERLDEHNMWYCSNCKDHVRAMKTMHLWRLPNVLIIHLKRFEFKQHHGFRRDKLDTLVDFPLEGLDMNQHCCSTASSADCVVNSKIPAMYDCFAVTNHFGSMGFGHYTAYARTWNECDELTNDWALFDDANVRRLSEETAKSTIISPAAYVLFYRRRIFS